MKLRRSLTSALIAGSTLLFAAGAGAQVDPFPETNDASPGTTTVATAPPVTNNLPGTSGNTAGNTTNITPPVTNQIVVPDRTTTQPNVNITNVIPSPPAVRTPAQAPPAPQTRVEVRNETPTGMSQPAAPAPNIDIDMPDINVVAPPAGSTDTGNAGQETVTRTDRFIYNDTDPDDEDVGHNNILYMAIFGILGVFLVAVIAMAYNRRKLIDDDLPTTRY